MTGDRKNNICQNCGYNKEPGTEVCPECEFITVPLKSEHQKEETGKAPKENLTETPQKGFPEIRLNPTLGSRRNFLYNLNPKTINLVLFTVAAIITGTLLFKYIMMLLATPNG